MTIRNVIERYLDDVRAAGAWEDLLADDITFTSLVQPNRAVSGKPAVLQALKRFYSMMKEMSVNCLVVEGDRAIAMTRYRLQPPGGMAGFDSDVAEVFTLRDGKIVDFRICFDSAPYPKAPA